MSFCVASAATSTRAGAWRSARFRDIRRTLSSAKKSISCHGPVRRERTAALAHTIQRRRRPRSRGGNAFTLGSLGGRVGDTRVWGQRRNWGQSVAIRTMDARVSSLTLNLRASSYGASRLPRESRCRALATTCPRVFRTRLFRLPAGRLRSLGRGFNLTRSRTTPGELAQSSCGARDTDHAGRAPRDAPACRIPCVGRSRTSDIRGRARRASRHASSSR